MKIVGCNLFLRHSKNLDDFKPRSSKESSDESFLGVVVNTVSIPDFLFRILGPFGKTLNISIKFKEPTLRLTEMILGVQFLVDRTPLLKV